ncbi:MAG: CCA tRNA nucleotidyltransferase [Thermoplasmatota archaeon]
MKFDPSLDEIDAMTRRAHALVDAVNAACKARGIAGRATIQGSVAKQTWLPGSVDLDCFVLVPTSEPESALKALAEAVSGDVLAHPKKKYAQHPYVVGEFQGAQVDLVPAYDVGSPEHIQSAVDRTPFHTEWVNANLSDAQKHEVRRLKAWCKGTALYGAETKIGGFSGYLLEVLVHHAGTMDGVLTWMRGDERRVALGADEVKDDVSPLVVVDPIDATRNCAAAVTAQTLERAAAAAAAYQAAPGPRFYEPAPPASRAKLAQALEADELDWAGLLLKPESDRLDIVFPQFQRAARLLADGIERIGFPVVRHHVTELEGTVAMQWVTKKVQRPPTRLQKGPRADKPENVKKFKAKWSNDDRRVGDFEEVDGVLQVELRETNQTAEDALRELIQKGGYAKHFQAALKQHTLLTDPAAAPDDWNISDCILGQEPWQRPTS